VGPGFGLVECPWHPIPEMALNLGPRWGSPRQRDFSIPRHGSRIITGEPTAGMYARNEIPQRFEGKLMHVAFEDR